MRKHLAFRLYCPFDVSSAGRRRRLHSLSVNFLVKIYLREASDQYNLNKCLLSQATEKLSN
jgi:hypothetical protein